MGVKHVLAAVDEQVALNAFFHATYSDLPIGKRIENWGASSDPYHLVDRMRPTGKRARRSHFFLVDDPKCIPALGRDEPDLDVYEVSPEMPVGPLNYEWIDGIPALPPYTQAHRERVHNYWAGVPGPDPCLNEYIAEAVRVERYVGKLGDVLAGRAR